MKKMSKRWGAMLLTTAMAAGMSAGAFAADTAAVTVGTESYATLQQALDAVKNGQTIVLQKNVTEGASYTYAGEGARHITIDLNGHSIKTDAAEADGISLTSEQPDLLRVTIANGTIAAAGADSYAIETDGARLTLQNMQVRAAQKQGLSATDAKINVQSANITGDVDAISVSDSYVYLNAGVFKCTNDTNENGSIAAYTSKVYTASEDELNLDFVKTAPIPAVIRPADWREKASTTVTINNFADVKVGAWYYTPVYNMANQDVVVGISAWEFCPTAKITRSQLACMLANLSGDDLSAYEGTTNFEDVPANTWYSKEVAWAYDKGIISGYGNGKFGPKDSVTREQTCVMLYAYQTKILKVEPFSRGEIAEFKDMDETSSWAKTAVQTLAEEYIINGSGNEKDGYVIRPKGETTRAEMCTLLTNMQYQLLDK